jgi:hypothetical protein
VAFEFVGCVGFARADLDQANDVVVPKNLQDLDLTKGRDREL